MNILINLGEVLTPKARKEAFVGQTYGFLQEDGTTTRYKVIRISKTNRNVWAERVTLLTPEEMEKVWEDKRNDKTN